MSEDQATRRRRVRLLQKYFLNPPVELGVYSGLAPGHALIETVGRRTGRQRRTVVGYHLAGDTAWIVAEQGPHAGYLANLRADPRVRLRLKRRWHAGTAHPMPDDDPQRRLEQF